MLNNKASAFFVLFVFYSEADHYHNGHQIVECCFFWSDSYPFDYYVSQMECKCKWHE